MQDCLVDPNYIVAASDEGYLYADEVALAVARLEDSSKTARLHPVEMHDESLECSR